MADGFQHARARHAALRHQAYAVARLDALRNGVCGPDLHITDIDTTALKTWRATWNGVHPSGAGKWDWENLLERAPHRPAVLPIAIWYGPDLCGLAHGYASPHRASGVRHTISFTHIERRPEPPAVPLRRLIVSLAVTVAEAYGRSLGSSRVRLWNPDPRLLSYYRDVLGFEVAWKTGQAVYCESRIKMEKRPSTTKPMHADPGKRRSRPRPSSDDDLPSLAEARRRMLSKPGFFSSLTPEAKAAMLSYEGPENLGPGKYED